VSGPEYVSVALDWVEAQFEDDRIFPVSEVQLFPKDFLSFYCKEMATRLFRVYAILYTVYLDAVKGQSALAHMNTCFKHFFFFASCQFKLLDKSELIVLKSLTNRLSQDFVDAKEE